LLARSDDRKQIAPVFYGEDPTHCPVFFTPPAAERHEWRPNTPRAITTISSPAIPLPAPRTRQVGANSVVIEAAVQPAQDEHFFVRDIDFDELRLLGERRQLSGQVVGAGFS
jgi:hypothetical protein